MRSKILSKRMLLFVFLWLALCVTILLSVNFTDLTRSLAPPVESAGVNSHQEQTSAALPVRLKIPSINVNASVEFVGLTSDGAMDVPKDRANVAWFNLGQRPGENGTAVIAGHYGWKGGQEAVFDNLYKLRPGDKIYTEDEKGESVAFVVRESRRYDPDADATDVFVSSDGRPHLNLITCEGVWDAVSKTYSKRLVVFADKEE